MPQLSGSELVSTHFAPHLEKPALHCTPHCPLVQTGVPLTKDGHELEQVPQLVTSVVVFTHAVPHLAKPALHVNPHCPAAHVGVPFGGAGHAWLQVPQFDVSFCGSTHAPEQLVWLPEQVTVQMALEQTSVPVHW